MFGRTILAMMLLAPLALAQNRLIPDSLSAAKRKPLESFLAKLEKPKEFIPAGAKWEDRTPAGVQLDPAAIPTANPPVAIKEYLAEIRPQKAATKDGPDKADVYWYRPNPKKGTAGITVKRVVDLNTGGQVGETVVLVNYAPPLTAEEKVEALRLAKENSPSVKRIYEVAGDTPVEFTALFDQITSSNVPDGGIGDRVVILQVRIKGSPNIANVNVNLTRESTRERN